MSRVESNSPQFSSIIEGLCSAGKVEEAEAYFNALKVKSVEIYTSMVNGYCEAGLVEKSCKLFCEISKEGDISEETPGFKKLSRVMYSKVLAALCKEGNVEHARSLFHFFLERGFTPDVVTYTIMIKSYCRLNCLQEAHDLFRDMKSRGIKPDVITYTVLLDGKFKQVNLKRCFFSQHKKGSDATYGVSTILTEMQQTKVSPDVVIYTVLIDGFVKVDNFQEAVRFFNEIIELRLEPDNVTYTALLSGLLNRGHTEKAVILYNEMSSKGMMPPLPIISKLKRQVIKARKVQFRK
ncbi:unnamed protein product [Lathyrus sativus]|nr:unnamed protein product [Lathyrus sativus]